MPGLIDGIFSGISTGSVLLLAALGLSIVFGLMGVINMAHGELMMLGAYTTVMVQGWLQETPLAGGYVFVALIVAFVVTALFGLLLERGVIRFLYGRPLETLLATWGVSLMLQEFVRSVSWQLLFGIGIFCLLFFGALFAGRLAQLPTRLSQTWLWVFRGLMAVLSGVIAAVASFLLHGALVDRTQRDFVRPWFGAQNQNVSAPRWLSEGLKLTFSDGEIQLSYVRISIIILTIACLLGVYFFLNRTNWGLKIRAVTQNRNMSACLGIPTAQVDALTFAIGSGLAGIAGCAVSFLGPVGPNTGQNYIVDTFMVVVVGGVGNLVGSIIAALGIGVLTYLIGSNTILNAILPPNLAQQTAEFFSTSMAQVIVFALIVIFLQIRPAGLFPQKGRTAET
ncbi:MAG: urea ABC transporter permease subunit UrtB [Synechococcales bacterium]|nr:urea ABC transporter permease subunit UrtB [Synechococcales bacterium]